MKIALCLSGRPRCYKQGYEYHKRNLLDKHDVHVFVHTWEDIDDDAFQFIDYEYDPVSISTSQTFSDESFKKYPVDHPNWPPKNAIHMLYSVFRSNQLKREYELVHGFVFDVVIRSRFDFALNREIDFEVEPGKIYVPNDYVKGRIAPNGLICNDQFAVGDSPTIDLYSNTFWNIDRAASLGAPIIGEDLLSVNLQIAGLTGEKMVYIDMNHPFPPGKYNNTPHSLLRDDL
jgi:hypothetical protein